MDYLDLVGTERDLVDKVEVTKAKIKIVKKDLRKYQQQVKDVEERIVMYKGIFRQLCEGEVIEISQFVEFKGAIRKNRELIKEFKNFVVVKRSAIERLEDDLAHFEATLKSLRSKIAKYGVVLEFKHENR